MGLLISWRTLPSIPDMEGGRTRLPELGAVGFWDQQSICCLSAVQTELGVLCHVRPP